MTTPERTVEARLCKRVRDNGGEAYKFVSPSRRGVPDRLVLYPVPPEYQALVANYVRFVEVKAPGKKPNAEQTREHEKLFKMGFAVDVVDA